MNQAVAKVVHLYSRHEAIADGVVHVAGIIFAINASLWLLWKVTGLSALISVSVYCVGLMAMIGFSAAYNLMPQSRPSKTILRRLDHAAIFIMIAATYTPFAVNRLAPPWGDVILIAIWVLASLVVTMKVLFPGRFDKASVVMYLAMGWLIVTVIEPLAHTLARADFWLLIAGGLVYSAGVIFYLLDRLPFSRAIWHGFVLTAVVLHFACIVGEFAR
jgi:hemolysin III